MNTFFFCCAYCISRALVSSTPSSRGHYSRLSKVTIAPTVSSHPVVRVMENLCYSKLRNRGLFKATDNGGMTTQRLMSQHGMPLGSLVPSSRTAMIVHWWDTLYTNEKCLPSHGFDTRNKYVSTIPRIGGERPHGCILS